ncbi:MAG: alanine--glyoxylate aminotransferase family protein, partial [Herminiimonas sp.]|nr:alanine--glyoxylate aminotransferase family protein [Herminiimonas sp.]
LLVSRGFKSVAAEGFQSPGVVVSYTDDDAMKSTAKFTAVGVQVGAGVPLQCDEPADFKSFRVGLFGLDKLHNIERSVASFAAALDRLA